MNSKHKVLLVVGAWVSDTHKRWVFEPDHSFKGEHYINLYSGMNMSDLVRGVREEIDPTYEGVNFKLSYQYPEWISADVRSPKAHDERAASYINDTIAGRDGERDDCDIEDDNWHEFAMADNTVTIPDIRGYPGKRNLKILDAIPHAISGIAYTKTSAIPFQIGGVEIRESKQNIRQRIQPEPGVAMEKGKKKMRMETPSDTDSDSDDELLNTHISVDTNMDG
ncbi:hypothetical protein DY000_02058900 [Brassica cretica]|uniref:Uncharacterized protein n=1 Tax=Brassica cretica TaxID=69181 RepID=A0ABQ7ARM4_BRACR|nr:hypothetical protein DY000_02058894 [Brassica cretica]KAF3520211.1 hypothetical protein DY000_02058900 [Brassica cretica]